MKLILREYLAQLKERDELDAVLPDLLSEKGFHVLSRPQRGTTQHGVDFAAVSPAAAGPQKLYLFSLKRGDLTRQDWDGTPQALRSSLNEIRDVYIPTKIPKKYASLDIVICLCFGGDIQEQVQAAVRLYTAENTTGRISYEEWNGDRIAELMMDGVLREHVLPKPLQSSFRKAVALVDEPQVAYRHFSELVDQLRSGATTSAERVRAGRQIYICVWVMFVWGRDRENLEAPYQASELALLHIWDLVRTVLDKKSSERRDLWQVLDQMVRLHLAIATTLIDGKIAPHAAVRDAVGTAAAGSSAVDVNLALFDLLGRIAMLAHWSVHTIAQNPAFEAEARASLDRYVSMGLDLIKNNGALLLPLTDEQATSIALFLLAWARSGTDVDDARPWLNTMADRLGLSIRWRRHYPTSKTDYRELIAHPVDDSDAYFQEATPGSTLIPLLALWSHVLGLDEACARIGRVSRENLAHCAMQLWSVDDVSDLHLYRNDGLHGRAIMELPVEDPVALKQTLIEAAEAHADFANLSANRVGLWPIVLIACRHWRLPVPIEFLLEPMVAATAAENASEENIDGGGGDVSA